MESRNKVGESSEIQDHILPNDIVGNILSRLPGKSVIRFRCASKSWRYLTGTRHFIQTHLENSGKYAILAYNEIIMRSYGPSSQPDNCLRTSPMNEPSWEATYHVLGCCDGLICFLGPENKFFLWNPSTRLSNKLPDIKLKEDDITRCEFGFDERNDDYKVLAVGRFKTEVGNYREEGRIYSLKSNSWTEISMPQIHVITKVESLLLKGKVRWTEFEYEAVSFGLESVVHGSVKPPGSKRRRRVSWPWSSLVLGSTEMNTQIIKQDSVKECWSKFRSISFHTCEWESISISFRRSYICWYPYIYEESLVSPLPGEHGQRSEY